MRSLAVALPFAMALACGTPASPPASSTPTSAAPALDLGARHADYVAAIGRARAWLDELDVRPAALRARGIKGKKKLAELMHCYLRLLQIAPDEAAKAELRARMTHAARVTTTPGYHNFATADERTLREVGTSYLRVAYLMDAAGLDTSYYRSEILKVKPRLDAHIATRGVHQREAFALYYAHFGMPFPEALRPEPEAGVIAARPDPAAISDADMYQVTHEVFVPYDYGFARAVTVTPFTGAELDWLRAALPVMLERTIAANNADLAGELTAALAYVGERRDGGDALAHAGVWLLDHQNADGSFGDYSALALRLPPEDLKYRVVLHTTLVSLDALVAVFGTP